MSDFFHNKDYGDYFRQIEQKLSNQDAAAQPVTKVPDSRVEKRPFWRRIIIFIVIIAILFGIFYGIKSHAPKGTKKSKKTAETVAQIDVELPSPSSLWIPRAARTEKTTDFYEKANCKNGIIIDLSTHEIVAARKENERVSPASTTKVMTALVAVNLIDDYDKTFVMTQKIADDTFLAHATNAGFAVGETVNMTDLLYGCLLPSGADATIGLAEALCGTEAAFVEKMNEKADELGLTDTHFVNATGLYDKNHYSSAADMAIITEAALQNPLLHQILSTVDYTTASTPQHPDGIPLTGTLFSYMYGTEPDGADILAGKTGFVNESGYCFTTYGETDNGTPYIVVMFGGVGQWPSVFGLIDLYSDYVNDP